jgi:hypothetical protein
MQTDSSPSTRTISNGSHDNPARPSCRATSAADRCRVRWVWWLAAAVVGCVGAAAPADGSCCRLRRCGSPGGRQLLSAASVRHRNRCPRHRVHRHGHHLAQPAGNARADAAALMRDFWRYAALRGGLGWGAFPGGPGTGLASALRGGPGWGAFHDREGFTTPGSSKPFVIMVSPVRLHDREAFYPTKRGKTLRDHGRRPECLNAGFRHNGA